MKTAMFCRFGRISACACNFPSETAKLRVLERNNPIREDDLVKKQLCSVDFDVNLRARATFSSETVEFRVLEGKNISERMIQ